MNILALLLMFLLIGFKIAGLKDVLFVIIGLFLFFFAIIILGDLFSEASPDSKKDKNQNNSNYETAFPSTKVDDRAESSTADKTINSRSAYRQANWDSLHKQAQTSISTKADNIAEKSTPVNWAASQTQYGSANLLYDQGNANARMGMFEDALSLYDQAIVLDGSKPMYYNNRTAVLKRLGRFQEAIKQYEEITQKIPDYGKAFLSISSTCIEVGNYQGAVSSYRRFLTAYKDGQFTFNPVIGGISKVSYGENLLETALLTSINYLSVDQ